jgi:predicted NBD/HSP70 family sugar kinase
MTVAIGIDLGGTQLRAAVVSADGEVLAHAGAMTASMDGPA